MFINISSNQFFHTLSLSTLWLFQLKQQSITCASVFLVLFSMASAQLTYHLDANTNSYTVQTPNSQQTFTQHFNRKVEGQIQPNQLQAAHSQPQPQQQVIHDFSQNIQLQNIRRCTFKLIRVVCKKHSLFVGYSAG